MPRSLRRAPVLLALALALVACGGSADDTDPGAAPTADASTAPASPGDDATDDEPSPEPTPTSAPAVAEPSVDPATACGEEEFGIVLTFPSDGDVITDGSPLEGCGSTFEATYQWEVVFEDGTTDSGFGTMTCGSGCIGSFSEPLPLSSTGPATLTVYESSAKDGSRTNEVTVDVEVV